MDSNPYIDNIKSKRKFLSNYILRDILIWILFLLIMPLCLFCVYQLANKSSSSASDADAHVITLMMSTSTTSVKTTTTSTLKYDESNISQSEVTTKKFLDAGDFVELDVDDEFNLMMSNGKNGRSNAVELTGEDEEIASESIITQSNLKNLIMNFNKQMGHMKRVSLRKYDQALCNDGSIANYYIRLSSSNVKHWIIQLDGGYFCYDQLTCKQRFINSHNLTSSIGNKLFKTGNGILSSSHTENKYWHDANVVSIPYCSSDLWIGNKKCQAENCTTQEEFHFLGSKILDSVIDDLVSNFAMKDADLIVFTGISAGGIGVLMNVNKLKENLKISAPNADVKAIVDSSWLLDLPYSFLCNVKSNIFSDNDASTSTQANNEECIIHKMFRNLIDYWKAEIPKECTQRLKNSWDCFIPYKLIPFIKADILVIQNKFDETQMLEQHSLIKALSDNGNVTSNLKTIEANNFVKTIKTLNKRIEESIYALDYFFLPACVSHVIITKSDWVKYQIDGIYLQDLIHCWAFDAASRHSLIKSANRSKVLRCDKTKLMETCSWPNCSKTCQGLTHPDIVSKSVGPIEYFSYYGVISFRSIANKLKLSEKSVRKMSYTKLMKQLMTSS